MKKTLIAFNAAMVAAIVTLAFELGATNQRLTEEAGNGLATESMVVSRGDREKALEARIETLETNALLKGAAQ
jgi:hypothetical protein